eukprot:1220641-Pyramimonas_sp.AAC.1
MGGGGGTRGSGRAPSRSRPAWAATMESRPARNRRFLTSRALYSIRAISARSANGTLARRAASFASSSTTQFPPMSQPGHWRSATSLSSRCDGTWIAATSDEPRCCLESVLAIDLHKSA